MRDAARQHSQLERRPPAHRFAAGRVVVALDDGVEGLAARVQEGDCRRLRQRAEQEGVAEGAQGDVLRGRRTLIRRIDALAEGDGRLAVHRHRFDARQHALRAQRRVEYTADQHAPFD